MPSAFSLVSSEAARSRLGLHTSAFGVMLSMRGLRFQSVVNVVPLPACFLVVNLHVKRQCELAAGENRIEIAGEDPENMFAGGPARCEIAPLAKPQHHGEKTEIRFPVRDCVVLATDGADANAPERKDPGFDCGLADDFDQLAHVDAGIEVG